jgi:3-hydroxybutyryl-CoA dehydrogenase
MRILVIGDESNLYECRKKFGDKHDYEQETEREKAQVLMKDHDVIFDFLLEDPSQLDGYGSEAEHIVFLNTATITLHRLIELTDRPVNGVFFGFAGLPTFLDRPVLEVCLYKKDFEAKLTETCARLNTAFQVVEDRVGLVTPRVICMIVNEAYFTVQEGTASRSDIDLAMKLGTNYPWGPFEWCTKIGIRNVCELLKAVYEDTKDERYIICSLLQEESNQS